MKIILLIVLSFLYITSQGQLTPNNTDTATINPVVSQPKTTYETVSTESVSITYARPHRTGYKVFGNLRKYGKVWAVGAGKASTISFARDVNFAGVNVAAGSYTLFVIPYENQWTVILNTQLEQRGTSTYEKYKERNIATVNVPVTQLLNPVEQLTIRFTQSTSMIIEWDNVQITIPVL